MDYKKIVTPLTNEKARGLKAGEKILLTGTIYTGRDAAHKKMVEALQAGDQLPFDLRDQTIYYVGPTPAPPGKAIGSAGPTTSGRMDAYSPSLIKEGLKGMIGKGMRSVEVIQAMKEHGAVYFGAIGGAGALLADRIVKAEVIAYPELGTEAVHKLEVEDFPVIVLVDSYGVDLYQTGREKYRK